MLRLIPHCRVFARHSQRFQPRMSHPPVHPLQPPPLFTQPALEVGCSLHPHALQQRAAPQLHRRLVLARRGQRLELVDVQPHHAGAQHQAVTPRGLDGLQAQALVDQRYGLRQGMTRLLLRVRAPQQIDELVPRDGPALAPSQEQQQGNLLARAQPQRAPRRPGQLQLDRTETTKPADLLWQGSDGHVVLAVIWAFRLRGPCHRIVTKTAQPQAGAAQPGHPGGSTATSPERS